MAALRAGPRLPAHDRRAARRAAHPAHGPGRAEQRARSARPSASPSRRKQGTTTGISAADRATTVLAAIDPRTQPEDLARPGPHVPPARPCRGACCSAPGQTEAAVDLARLAGLYPAGVICEIMNEDGTMARVPQLEAFCREHDIRMITIRDLIQYRMQTRAARAQDRRGEPAHPLRRLPDPRLREPDRRPAPRGAGDGRGAARATRARARALPVPDRRHLLLDPLRLRRPARTRRSS